MCCIHTFIVFCQHFICPPVWPGILCCSCISGIALWLKAEFYEIVKRHLVSCQYCHLLEKFLDDINVFESVYFYKSKFLLSYPVVRGIQKLRSTEIRGGKHIWERTIPYLNLNINFRMWEQITDSVIYLFFFSFQKSLPSDDINKWNTRGTYVTRKCNIGLWSPKLQKILSW